MHKILIFLFIVSLTACSSPPKKEEKKAAISPKADTFPILPEAISTQDTPPIAPISIKKPSSPAKISPDTMKKKPILAKNTDLEQTMITMGLVDIQTIAPSIGVEVKYSTTDNFMKTDAYGDLNKIFLQKEVAEMLAKAQTALKKTHQNYSLLVFDGARPFRVQQKMWELVKGTDMAHYVARPDAKGSMHNYGCAVDLTVVDEKGKELDMGTPFDYLGALAQPSMEEEYVKQGKLTRKQVDNRLILRRAMESAGFTVLKREWWHFNAFGDSMVLQKYKRIP